MGAGGTSTPGGSGSGRRKPGSGRGTPGGKGAGAGTPRNGRSPRLKLHQQVLSLQQLETTAYSVPADRVLSEADISLAALSQRTGIQPQDIISTLQALKMLKVQRAGVWLGVVGV